MIARQRLCPAPSRPRRKAFTLIELLVVVAIIALLVSLLMPNLGRAMELARRTQCATNLGAIGKAWSLYWSDQPEKLRTSNIFNPICNDWWSNFNFRMYEGSHGQYGGTTGQHHWTTTGPLYNLKYITTEGTFVCPTWEKNLGEPWFNDPSGQAWQHNLLPVDPLYCTSMTYGQRRMLYYDPSDAGAPGDFAWEDKFKLLFRGIGAVRDPARFSYTADRFNTPNAALMSHVPGINVMYADAHVAFYNDATADGRILYNNGIPESLNSTWNILHDDIWMIIDGYHQGPPGQGF